MENVTRFIALQDKANQEIDELGQTTQETFDALEALGDSLNPTEIEELLSTHLKRGTTQ